MSLSNLGYGFGLWSLGGVAPWNLHGQNRGGSVMVKDPDQPRRGGHINDCEPTGPVIWRGNYFPNFTHQRDVIDRNYWYWDNPLLPQFSGPSRACTAARKFYNRIVYNGLFPHTIDIDSATRQRHCQRINRNLKNTGLSKNLQDVFRPQTFSQGSVVVLAMPTDSCLTYWYGITRNQLERTVRRQCERMNLALRIRAKPTPNQKYSLENTSWQFQRQGDEYCVIGVHSAIGMEIIEQGIPYVALGGHGCLDLATTWQEFCQGQVKQHSQDDFLSRTETLLSTVWLREDVISGQWSTESWAGHQGQPWEKLPGEFYE